VSESSETGQASIVFLGRESFRMQVVGAEVNGTNVGAIPTAFWEGPTARIIERRNFDRRHGRRPVDRIEATAVVATPAPEPGRKNLIIGISLLTFACGVALATAANRLPRQAGDRIAQIERRQAVMPPLAPAPQPAAAAMIVEPLAKPAEELEPAPAPVVSAPVVSARPAPRPALAKAVAPAPRAVSGRAVAQRRPTPATSPRAADLEADDPFEAKPAPASPKRKWVDPFAE